MTYGNKYSPTIIVSAITTKIKTNIPTHIFVSAKESGLAKDSIILVEQIRTIDKIRVIKRVGHLSDFVMEKIKKALKLNFNIRGDVFEFLSGIR